MNSTLETLRQWSEQGWLRRLDSALAGFVLDHDPQAEPATLVASALLAHMEGRGHVCLPLIELVQNPQAVLGWPEKAQSELNSLWASLPTAPHNWVNALKRSPVVRCVSPGHPDTGQPLVLDGTAKAPLLYLRRYWVYEQQVAHAVGQRVAAHQRVDTEAAKDWLDRMFAAPSGSEAGTSSGDEPQWQKIACALALRSGLTVITGGPGTGKTYTAARLLALLLATSQNPAQLRVALAAPTGKAAARLRQSIDQSLVSLQSSLGAAVDLQALTERIGQASTVHALLGMRVGSRQFNHNAQHQLDLDVLIVDETSMVHLEMMAALLQALPPHAKLILLGDKDQLASVEAGSVLGDLCAHAQQARYSPATCAYVMATCGQHLLASTTFTSALEQQTVMLRHSHRFGSDIGALAKAVNAGLVRAEAPSDLFTLEVPLGAYDLLARGTRQAHTVLPSAVAHPGKVYLVPTPLHPDALVQLALHGRPLAPASYADYLREIQLGPWPLRLHRAQPLEPETAHTDWVKRVLKAFDRFRILCAVHEGDWGDRVINHQVQRALASQGLLQPEGEWFVGRPVMVTRNDKALGVFNGDVGVVLPGHEGGRALRAYFLDGEQLRSVSVSRLAHVETAFAMTIHKSQGSEFAHTVVVLPDVGGDILTRELVYTGITRAKEYLSLVEPRVGLLGEAMAQQVRRASGLGALSQAG